MHNSSHPQASQTVKVRMDGEVYDYRLEDWWDVVTGSSWMFADGNPAALQYAMRSAFAHLPLDNEVVYGKIGGLGYLVHVSELDVDL